MKTLASLFLSDLDEKTKEYTCAEEFVILSPELEELGRFRTHLQNSVYQSWRNTRVTPEGYIYKMLVERDYVIVRKHEIFR